MNVNDMLRYFMLFINDIEGRETFVMQLDKPNEHFTLQIRHRERMLDLHKTTVLPGGNKAYETLFQISFYALARFFAKLRKEGKRVEGALNTMEDVEREFGTRWMNPGWFGRNYMEATHADLDKMKDLGLLRTKNRGRQVRFTKDPTTVDQDAMLKVIHSEMEPGKYILLKWNKGGSTSFAGSLLVLPEGERRFLWIPKKALNIVAKKLVKLLLGEFKRLEGTGGKEVYERLRKNYPMLHND
ncbi:MAG: hypothetical protein JNL52_03050 [Flavobacteriales bacterium]|nr:hypothetical protein [Flavobacteriales bacterium]